MFNNWNHNKYIYIKNFMLEKNFLKIIDVEIINSQGGSLRCFISKQTASIKPVNKVNNFLRQEIKKNLFKMNTWNNFAVKINNHRRKLKNFLKKD